MPGLVPGIHALLARPQDVDGRVICAKTRFALLPGHDEKAKPLRGEDDEHQSAFT
jgi:hypothetical protein